MGAHHVSLSTQGPITADPRLPRSRVWLLNRVITRGTPPRLEGCRPASRGLTLALMTGSKLIACHRLDANGTGAGPLVLLVVWLDEQPLTQAAAGGLGLDVQ
jgi:hypothetical protein